jgi:ABC-type Mn2+/Zn2+ transport system ATPase subunit
VSPMAGRISMGTRREITAAVVDRYRSAGRMDKGRILDELCAVTGWHRKRAVRALASHVAISPEARRQRRPTYGAPIRDALVALWEASDRICGKRLRVMIPTLLPSLERHGRANSGRSEVARAIFGADPPDSGCIEIAGEQTELTTPAHAIRRRIGYCPEDRKKDGIIPDMSVSENLTLALLPHLARVGVVDQAKQREIVAKFMTRLGIKAATPDQKIRELSGGNQQKVLLARWLCTDPALLILDEPTRGIDVGAKGEIQSLIDELAADGLGVLMISSELEELVEGANRVFVLREGETAAELAGEAISEPTIMAVMAHGNEQGRVIAGPSLD